MIKLTREPIDTATMLSAAQSPDAGAVLLFLGVTRQFTDQRETTELHYDAYEQMALKELETLKAEACQRWSLADCSIVHRLGLVPLGEASVAIVTASSHRQAAFQAGEWLIDTLKQRVPIWKQENWADGKTQWVHPVEEVIQDERSVMNDQR